MKTQETVSHIYIEPANDDRVYEEYRPRKRHRREGKSVSRANVNKVLQGRLAGIQGKRNRGSSKKWWHNVRHNIYHRSSSYRQNIRSIDRDSKSKRSRRSRSRSRNYRRKRHFSKSSRSCSNSRSSPLEFNNSDNSSMKHIPAYLPHQPEHSYHTSYDTHSTSHGHRKSRSRSRNGEPPVVHRTRSRRRPYSSYYSRSHRNRSTIRSRSNSSRRSHNGKRNIDAYYKRRYTRSISRDRESTSYTTSSKRRSISRSRKSSVYSRSPSTDSSDSEEPVTISGRSKVHVAEESRRLLLRGILDMEYWDRTEECHKRKKRHMKKLDNSHLTREEKILQTTLKNCQHALEPNMFPYDTPKNILHWTFWSRDIDCTNEQVETFVEEWIPKNLPNTIEWDFDLSNLEDGLSIDLFHVHVFFRVKEE